MLTRTVGRRAASALLAALVALILVTVGGPARSSADRVSADSGHAQVTAKHVRATQAVAPEHDEQARVHVDIATTPPVTDDGPREFVAHAAPTPADVRPTRGVVAPTGRGPPAV